jgi:hypothetical protein
VLSAEAKRNSNPNFGWQVVSAFQAPLLRLPDFPCSSAQQNPAAPQQNKQMQSITHSKKTLLRECALKRIANVPVAPAAEAVGCAVCCCQFRAMVPDEPGKSEGHTATHTLCAQSGCIDWLSCTGRRCTGAAADQHNGVARVPFLRVLQRSRCFPNDRFIVSGGHTRSPVAPVVRIVCWICGLSNSPANHSLDIPSCRSAAATHIAGHCRRRRTLARRTR